MIRIVPSSVAIAVLALLTGVQAFEGAAALFVPLQPLAQQAHQIENALAYLGQPFSAEEISKIDEAVAEPNESRAVERLQNVLDSHVLAVVRINAESRVKVEAGPALPELVESGTRLFLVKVINDAGVTAQLKVESPNSGDVYMLMLLYIRCPLPPGPAFRYTTILPCSHACQALPLNTKSLPFTVATPARDRPSSASMWVRELRILAFATT